MKIGNVELSCQKGDITKIETDVIVNAANSSLLGGSGVDGAIHRSGGPTILEECQKIRSRQGGCEVGHAVITSAGNLPAQYVIHTVGPYWSGGMNNEPILLKNAYISCFALAKEYNIGSISLPNISTGIYKFPKQLAAEIALDAIISALQANSQLQLVNIVCFEKENQQIYLDLMSNM